MVTHEDFTRKDVAFLKNLMPAAGKWTGIESGNRRIAQAAVATVLITGIEPLSRAALQTVTSDSESVDSDLSLAR